MMTERALALKRDIQDKCRSHWENTGKAYLLSRLGLDFPGAGQLTLAATGKKLLDFVSSEMADEVRIEQWPRHKNIWGLFPKDAELAGDLNSYFEMDHDRTAADRPPRYIPRFWAAFAKPLDVGKRRAIDPQSAMFYEIPESSPMPADMLEIDRRLIPPTDVQDRDILILSNVESWLKEHKLEGNRFLVSGMLAASSERTASVEGKRWRSELDTLIEAVGSRDLSRVNLPLDIVHKLLNRPSRS